MLKVGTFIASRFSHSTRSGITMLLITVLTCNRYGAMQSGHSSMLKLIKSPRGP